MKADQLRRWEKYFQHRTLGNGISDSAKTARLDRSTCYRFERSDPKSPGLEAASILGITDLAGKIIPPPMRPEAVKALEDFAYFRRRYFGRESTPWQVRAAYEMLSLLETPDKEYAVVNMPPGCLSGETWVGINRAGNGTRIQLKDLHDKINGVKGHWNPNISTMIQRHDGDGRCRLGEIARVVDSGEAETFTLRLSNGTSLRATLDHLFQRPDRSFTRLGELAVGDLVNVRGERQRKAPAKRKRYQSTNTWFHPNQRTAKRGFRVWTHRLVMEAHLNGLGYADYLDALRNDEARCKEFTYLTPDDVVHHINHVHTDNRLDNLALTTHTEHHRHHADESNVLMPVVTATVTGIERWGIERTYDIELAETPHNFIADGVVVHNSGKSTLFTCDIPTWLIVRDRTIRILIGSGTLTKSTEYVNRIKRALSRTSPLQASMEEVEAGIAFDAEGCLSVDFGVFKPPNRSEKWRADSFVVQQLDGTSVDDKEDTVRGVGIETDFLGWRGEFCIWDDLVTGDNMATQGSRDKIRRKWDQEAENRIEKPRGSKKGGVIVLQGQRLSSNDLYRWCVSADAITITERGELPLRDVTIGDRVLTRDGFRDVLYSGSQGVKDTLTVTTTRGRVLSLTPDHKIATPSGWVRADALTAGADLLVVGQAESLPLPVQRLASLVPAGAADSGTLAVDVGVRRGELMPLVAMGPLSQGSNVVSTPHVPPMILTDEVFGAYTWRVPAYMAGLIFFGYWSSTESVIAEDHSGDQLFAGEHGQHRGSVATVILGSEPDQALALGSGSVREPISERSDCSAQAVAGSAAGGLGAYPLPTIDTVLHITHGPMIETWDFTVNETHEFYANGVLVHNCLDKRNADDTPKYRHLVYKAHYEDLCSGDHDHITKAWPESCLLDPWRLDWKFLGQQMQNKRLFQITYQQEDVDLANSLVDMVWIKGGTDEDGYRAPGCLDKDRYLNDPPEHVKEKGWSFVTVDPSPSEFWGIIHWCYDPDTQNMYIINIKRARLSNEQFISYDLDYTAASDSSPWSGLVADWTKKATIMGIPIQHWIVEQNAAQKWLLPDQYVQKWQKVTGQIFIPHQTGGYNKNDPKYGLNSIADLFRQGRVRIPWADIEARNTCSILIDEVTRFPDFDTTDLAMSVWFARLGIANSYSPQRSGIYQLPRPAFMRREYSRGIA